MKEKEQPHYQPDRTQAPHQRGEGTRGRSKPQLEHAQPLIESGEGNPPAPLTPEQQSRREKKLAYDRRYYQEHREEMLEYKRRYYQEHREELLPRHRQQSRRYRQEHREEIRVYEREYKRAYMRRYRLQRKEQASAQAEPQQPIQVFPSS
jgi:hypothetical protein